jgi:gamma-glutamyltranspeptidase/glutathione hydrolase
VHAGSSRVDRLAAPRSGRRLSSTLPLAASAFLLAMRLVLALVFVLLPACTRAQTAVPDPARGTRGMVVSAQVDASAAGLEVLQAGGNAVDAAVATGFALAVTFPVAGNVGGGGFMVIRQPDGEATTYDYRERAPAGATRDMFLDSTGAFVPSRSQRGYLASGVPGAVAGMLMAHREHGQLDRAAVLAPAIRLAREGFVLSQRQADRFNAYRDAFKAYPSTVTYFLPADTSRLWQAGETFVQTDLAAVLERIAQNGPDGFYRGETARLIADEMARGGGLITEADLADYFAVEREPITGFYRGHKILTMPPPSSGGVALMQLLHSVEPYPVGLIGYGSSALTHLMAEAMRRVYADRAQFLGDPDYADVPVAGLVDPAYSRARMADFNPFRATGSQPVTHGDPLAYESDQTTHYSVVDAEGRAVSVTTTINGGYGSLVVVDGAGFFLNNEMDDFAAKPGAPNMFGLLGSDANAIEPGKRMLSSMTPTIVEGPDGELLLVTGTPGGATIITTVFQVILNVIDHDMEVERAVNAGRIHHQWYPDELRVEPYALGPDAKENLRLRGWDVVERRGTWGDAASILVAQDDRFQVDPSGLDALESAGAGRILLGAPDYRGEGGAAGY